MKFTLIAIFLLATTAILNAQSDQNNYQQIEKKTDEIY